LQESVGLEAVQGGVDGALGEIEASVAPNSQALERGVAVYWALGDHGQEERVQVSLDVLARHY
jgi:hypothetical protein